MARKLTPTKTQNISTVSSQAVATLISVFDALPDSAYLRESQLVRSSKRPDSQTAPLPFSAPTLWRMVAAGKFPAPRKLSARVTAWQVSEVRAWLQAQASA
jgi:prophage regulatory protein